LVDIAKEQLERNTTADIKIRADLQTVALLHNRLRRVRVGLPASTSSARLPSVRG